MEATIFTAWIYDHLLPHAAQVKVAHPVMLRTIALAKKKNDRIHGGKIANCLRWRHSAGMPHRVHRDSGAAAQLALSAPFGAPDGAGEEPGLRAAVGSGSEPQQATVAQGAVFSRR
ncbi:MAG: hypothetical protein JOZ48_00250 [Acidobacteriaceae bacterium]|nr:hypothetical protein [Acidobacteriaceae bacterium]